MYVSRFTFPSYVLPLSLLSCLFAFFPPTSFGDFSSFVLGSIPFPSNCEIRIACWSAFSVPSHRENLFACIASWKTILPFFVKTHVSICFVDYGFLPNTVFFQHTEKSFV